MMFTNMTRSDKWVLAVSIALAVAGFVFLVADAQIHQHREDEDRTACNEICSPMQYQVREDGCYCMEENGHYSWSGE